MKRKVKETADDANFHRLGSFKRFPSKGASATVLTEVSDTESFRSLTGADLSTAKRALSAAHGQLEAALNAWFDNVLLSSRTGERGDSSGMSVVREQPTCETVDLTCARDFKGNTPSEKTSIRYGKPRETRNIKDIAAEGLVHLQRISSTSIGLGSNAWKQAQDGWAVSIALEREAAEATAAAAECWAEAAGAGGVFLDPEFPALPSSIDGLGGGVACTTPICLCGAAARLSRVAREGPNQGRPFHSCPARRCRFFAWADRAPSSASAASMRWLRLGPPTHVPAKARGFDASDVRQGGVGDCWFLSALSVVATRPELIGRVFPCWRGPEGSAAAASGAYLVRLFLDGRWQAVLVDSLLPAKPTRGPSSASRGRAAGAGSPPLAFSRGADNQLWVPLVEKDPEEDPGRGSRP
mmetsp:Transcript_33508/g.79502  ORF Transcript_33508/g.79502 Transcript_33508/m.79502 type:complete len:411 (+) Transcript_33508:289-1521(+)